MTMLRSTPALQLALALALLIAGQAHAQSNTVLTDPVVEQDLVDVRASAVDVLANGDAIVSFAAERSVPQVIVRRVSRAGDRLWSATLPVPQGPLPMVLQSITPGGDIFVVAHPGSAYTRAFALDSATGAIRWEREIEFPTVSQRSIVLEDIAATDDGDLLVALWFQSTDLSRETTVFARFGGATGIEVWRYEDSVIWTPTRFSMTASAHGVDLIEIEPAGNRALRIAPDGSVDHDTTFASALSETRKLLTDDAGNLYTDDITGLITSLDPSGAVRWERRYSVQSATFRLRTVSANGSLWGLALLGGARLASFDPSGQLLGTASLATAVTGVEQIIATADGGAVVQYSTPAPAPVGNGRLSAFAPDVTLLWSDDLGAAGATGFSGLLAEGDKGHVWCARARRASSTVTALGLTLKLVPPGDTGLGGCTASAPNSSGQVGTIRALGDDGAALNNVTLLAEQLPASQLVLFLNSRLGGLTPNPGGSDGTLCLGGSINRYVGPGQIRRSDPAGRASLELDLPITPDGIGSTSILAGDTWHFQAWHSDLTPAGSNLTGSTVVMFR